MKILAGRPDNFVNNFVNNFPNNFIINFTFWKKNLIENDTTS